MALAFASFSSANLHARGFWSETVAFNGNANQAASNNDLGNVASLTLTRAAFNAWSGNNMFHNNSLIVYRVTGQDQGTSYSNWNTPRTGGSGNDHYFGWNSNPNINLLSGLTYRGTYTFNYFFQARDNGGTFDSSSFNQNFTLTSGHYWAETGGSVTQSQFNGGAATLSGNGLNLVKAGAGEVTLNANNTYTGSTTVRAGTLTLSTADANLGAAPGSPSAGHLAIWSTGTLRLTTTDITLNSNRGIDLGNVTGADGPAFSIASGRTLTYGGIMTGAADWIKGDTGTLSLTTTAGANTGKATIRGGTLRINNDRALGAVPGSAGERINIWSTGTFEADGTFTLSSTRRIELGTVSGPKVSVTSGNTLTYGGQISGSANWSKESAGTLVLTGASTFSGTLTISSSGGAVNLQHSSALGSAASVSVSGGTALQIQGGVTASRPLTLNGTGVSTDGALRNISGNNTVSGAITLGSAARINSDGGTLTLDVSSGNAIAGTHNLTIGGNGNVTVSDPIATSTGTLTKDGNGTLLLAAGNTYTGVTTINAGTLQINGNNRISDSSAVTLAGGTLQVSGTAADTMAALNVSSTGTIDMGAGDADLTFASLTGVTTSLAVINWTSGTDTITFSNAGGLTEANLAKITVNGGASAASGNQLVAATAAGAPTSVAVTPGNGSLAISFVAPASTGGRPITGYKYSLDGGSTWSASSGSTSTSINVSSLNNGQTYQVRVLAVTAFGDGTSTSTSVAGTPRTVPGAPTIDSITAGSQQLSVAFSAPSSNGGNAISNYEFSTNGGTNWTVRNPASATSPLVITGLTNGQTYSVRIRAVNDAGQGAQSGAVNGTPVAAPTLTAVTLTSALSGTYGTPSTGVSFAATGTSLTGNITVTAQSGFEVSTSVGSGYGSSVVVAGGTTVYVRTAASRAAGTANDTVVAVLSGGGAASNVNVTSSGSGNSVAQAPLTITGLSAAHKTYDGTTTVSVSGTPVYSGLVNGESASVTGAVTWAFPNATAETGKTLSRSGSYNAPSANYALTQPSLTANITPRSLTITANNVAKTYGATLSGGSGSSAFTASGQVSGETPGTVTITYTGSPSGALAAAAVGTYNGTVVPSALTGGSGGFVAGNYSISYVAGNVTVNKAVLTVTAANQTVGTGTPVATVTGNGSVSYSGFVNSENSSVVSGTVTYTTTYTSSDAAGTAGRTITPVVTGLSATNYSFTAANGTITVASPTYGMRDDGGTNLPRLTYWYAGAPADVTERGDQFSKNLGNLTSLFIKGANIKSYKNGAGNVTGTLFEYKIWREGTTEPASFTTQSVGFTSNDGGGNQTWSGGDPSTFAEINVFTAGNLGTNYGTYNVKIQFTVQGSGVAGKVSEGPYTATFVHPQPASITIGGNAANVTASAFTTTYGTASTAQTFAIAGTSLTANITATAPTGFEVSSNGSTYGSTATFTQTSGSASGTLHVRLAATAAANGTYNSQSIALTSTGATQRDITTPSSGNSVSKATPSITAAPTASSSVIKGDKLFNGLLSGGTASTAGTFTFNDTTSEQTASGSKAVTFTPTDTTNFNTASTNVNVTVDPVPDPTNVGAASSGTTSIALTHNLTSSKNVMIVRRAGSAVTFTPADDTTYSDGQDVGSGQTVVRGSLAANTSSDTGLSPSTTYHYKIFSENWGWYSPGVATSATTSTPPPTISVSGTPAAMSTTYGSPSSPTSFTVSGSNLTANLTVTAPSGFEVSTNSGSGYGASVSLTPSSGTVGNTTIHVRLKSNASPGSNSGNVTAASTGATSQTVAVSGTVNVPSMSMTIASPAGTMNADYTTSKLYADELAGTTNNVTVTFNTGNSNAAEVEVWTNLNNRDRANLDANDDEIPDGIVPPAPPSEKPQGYAGGAYPSNGYFQAHPMSGSGGTYTLTLNANKTGAYRLTARYRVSGGDWVWYNLGGKRDHAITVTPVLARNMNVYEINVLNINATGDTFQTRSTFEGLTNSANGRVNLDYLRNLGVNTLWFQPIHPNGVEGREPSGGWDSGTGPYDPGSPYAVKNFFEVMEQMSQGNSRASSMTAFTNFVTAADAKGVHVMLDAPFNHTAYDVEFGDKGLQVLSEAGISTNGWSATDQIRNKEARFFSRNDGANAYAGPASSAGNIAVAPDRDDFGKWRDVLDVFFGRYSTLVTGNPGKAASEATIQNEDDTINFDDLLGTGGVSAEAAAVTRAVWQYFAAYVPHWLEKTGLPAGSPLAEQTYKGVDGLRADFGQGMPPQFWEYAINVARAHKWSFVFMTESLDGGKVTYRSNRHFDILNENIVFPWQAAADTSAHKKIFEDRRTAYGQGLVLLNNTSHDEAGYADPWEAFIRYAVGSTIDGAPMIMYGQEIGTGASLSFNHYELNFGKSIPHFKRWNSMNPQWLAWNSNSLGVQNLMPNYSGVGLAREFSRALRSSNRYFLDTTSGGADPDIFAVAKYETANASPATSDVVLAFVNLRRNSTEANTFAIPSDLGALLGIEPNQLYNVKNIAAYLGPNNEFPNRRSEFLWPTPRLGSDIISNGVFVSLNGVPSTDGGWTNAPYEAQFLKVYAAPGLTTSGSPSAVTTIYGSASTNTSFTLSANNVHDGVTVTAPAGFQISTNASSGFAGSLSLTNTGTIGATTIFARLAATNPVGSYAGNVTISSPGGTNTTVALPSSTVSAKALTITGATATSRVFNGTTNVTVSGGSLVGVVGGDAVTLGGSPAGTVANANVGTDKPVTVTGYTIGGGSAGNYTLTQPTGVTVNITQATPTIVTAPTATAITEGQALSASTLSGGAATGVGGASVGGGFTFASPNFVPAVGTASQSVIFTPSDANYTTTTGLASVTVNAAAVPLPENATLVDNLDGSFTLKIGTNTVENVSYLYTGRSVGGLNHAYTFLAHSNTNAPVAPGFYTVTATASGTYTGGRTNEYAIAGPLALPAGQAIEVTKIEGATTVRLNRSTLLGGLQRVATNGTISNGATGLTWTATERGTSQMPPGYAQATMLNTVTNSSSFVTLTPPGGGASTSDSFTLTVSDGTTPATFPVTVTSTNAPPFDLVIRKLVPIEGDTNSMKAIFLTRPNRNITMTFAPPNAPNDWKDVTSTNNVISTSTQPATMEHDGQMVQRPPASIPTGSSGVLEFRVPANAPNMMFRARPVISTNQ